jgi:DHA2 family multidrug resistance protein-like MFS transporter
VVFVRRQAALEDPLVDVRLFRRAPFAIAVAAMCVVVFLVAGTDFFVGQYLQLVSGTSPVVAGLWMLPGVVGLVAGSLVAPALAERMRAANVLVSGLALAAVGTAALTQLRPGDGLAPLVVGTTMIGLGAGAVGTLATDLVVGAAPAEHAGAASATTETSAELGGALGVAILGSIGAAIYRHDLADDAPAAPRLERSREGLAGAVELGRSLPAELREDVIAAANGAFAHGLHLGALGAASMAAVLAALASVVLHGSGASAAVRSETAPARRESR